MVTDPAGRLLWISPVFPGRAHDLTAARTHQIIRICEPQSTPVLADRTCLSSEPWVTAPVKRPPGGGLMPGQRRRPTLGASRDPGRGGSSPRCPCGRVVRPVRCDHEVYEPSSVAPYRDHRRLRGGRRRPGGSADRRAGRR
ncbi:transposase family protein [Streptomyces roseifaciens]|uniref:transposase family protein n=1 Tax=Streptomyces roseifaciens TaxID=1488406 RepID=UPI003B83638F